MKEHLPRLVLLARLRRVRRASSGRGLVVVENGTERWLRLGPATLTLLMLNAATFVALTAKPDSGELLGLPAGWGELAQQPWTAITVMFTSGNLAHLLAALAVIVVAGGALERRVGSAGVLVVYLLSGLAASVAMATAVGAGVGSPQTSLGASGAFLGLVAALAAMPPSTAGVARLNLSKVMVTLVVINVLAPAAGIGDWTSTVAHLTGMAVGTLWSVWTRPGERVLAKRR